MAYIIAILCFFIISGVIVFDFWVVFKLASYILKIVRTIKGTSDEEYKQRLEKVSKIQRLILRHPTKTIIAFIISVNVLLLGEYISKYYNKDMYYPRVKALYVVGNIANTYSKALSVTLGAPDMWYLAPLHMPLLWIKEAIYDFGVDYLPRKEEDSERVLWKYDWFYHPYIIKFYEHRGFFNKHEEAYDFIRANEIYKKSLEDLWKMMGFMLKYPFADKNRYYDFLEAMPTIGKYFFLYHYKLLPKNEFKDIRIYGATNPKFVKYDIDLKNMMEEVYKRWNDPVFIKERLYKSPQSEATYQSLMLMIMEQRISELIYAKEFSCAHPMLKQYAELRKEFFAKNNGPLRLLIKNGKEKRARDFLTSAKDNIAAEYARQLLWEYCGIDLPGISRLYWPQAGDRGFHANLTAKRRLFANEIRILEDDLNITRIHKSKPTITKEDIEKTRSTK